MIRNLAVLEAVRDAIFLTDIDTGLIVDANPAAQHLCGRSIEEWRLLHRAELHPPEAGRSSRNAFAVDATGPGLQEGVILDSEGLLRESEERLKAAERLAHVGFWDWDIKANQASWSDEVLRILGLPQDYVPTIEESMERVAPRDCSRVEQWVRDCLARKQGSTIDAQVVRSDGALRTLSLVSEVVLDEEGQASRVFGSCQDVTDSRRAQDEAFARQKLESLGTLASGIAHDFNNLLGGVLAQAELGLAELKGEPGPVDELRRIRDIAVQGAEIVRQLMIYAGKENGSSELMDVSRIVTEMLDLLRVSVSKNVKLHTELSKTLPPVRATAAQLRRIVMNLVTNASDAMGDKDGTILVKTERVTASSGAGPSNRIAAGDSVGLVVSDTGVGMPTEIQAKVFDPFFSTKAAGRGLGLAVVQGVVRNLQGVIHLSSETGTGTTFQILLPVASGEADVMPEEAASQTDAANPFRASVLIVEDENSLREALSKLLRRKGYEVLEASNGSAALELLQANDIRIDAVLLDKTIPGISSQEVTVRAAERLPAPKIVLTSAYSQEMARAGMRASRIHAFIRKPFRFGDLIQTLESVLFPR